MVEALEGHLAVVGQQEGYVRRPEGFGQGGADDGHHLVGRHLVKRLVELVDQVPAGSHLTIIAQRAADTSEERELLDRSRCPVWLVPTGAQALGPSPSDEAGAGGPAGPPVPPYQAPHLGRQGLLVDLREVGAAGVALLQGCHR